MKWKIVEHPLKELLRIFKEGEAYIKLCLEVRDCWAKAITIYRDFHIHNLLSIIPIVVEAIEMAGQISGSDHEEIQKKYQKDLRDPRIFQWIFGKQYLVPQDFCNRIDSVWDEDRWFLLKEIKDKKNTGCLNSKRDHRLADVLFKYLSCSDNMDDVLLPSSTLVNSKDYQVRRRLGNGSEYKETFALRHFYGDVKPLLPEISMELNLCHPNVQDVLCGFTDEEKKECFLVVEHMNRDLLSYIKDICGPRKRIPFSIAVAVDLMLQIARGMECLHSEKVYHGGLNPSNILIKARSISTDGYLHAKVSGFGLSSFISKLTQKTTTTRDGQLSYIWYAPEVLAEQENFMDGGNSKYTEKSDV